MTVPRARAAAVLACLTAVTALAACSSDGGSSSSPSASTPADSSPVVASDTPAGTPTSDTPAGTPTSDAAPAALTAVLLTPDEVGSGYVLSSDQSSGTSALPCTPDAAPLFTQAPPAGKANRNYQSAGDDVEVSEVVASYPDAAAATKAFGVGSAGFACTKGTLNGTAVTIAQRTKGAPAGSSVDDLGAWDFATGGIKGTSVLVRAGSRLIGLTFVAKPEAAASVNVGQVTDTAATKVLRAG